MKRLFRRGPKPSPTPDPPPAPEPAQAATQASAASDAAAVEETRKPRTLDDVPGWFPVSDQAAFTWLLEWQTANEAVGDIVELGVYKGKSAVHLGRYLQPGERFTVIDLFEDVSGEESIPASEKRPYRTLTQGVFEGNYLDFHTELPVVLRGLSIAIRDHVEPDTCRFVHVDASHIYEHVRQDTVSARSLLRPGGIVCFDDFRSVHTPGTAAAVWEAVLNEELQVICITGQKLYGTWGDAEPARTAVRARIAADNAYNVEEQQIGDQRILRIY